MATEKQTKFRSDLKALSKIVATAQKMYFGTSNGRFNYLIHKAKVFGLFRPKFAKPTSNPPPWHTWERSPEECRENMRCVGRRRRATEYSSDRLTMYRYCIDCGEKFETVNEKRLSCDYCWETRCKFGGYRRMNDIAKVD